MQSDTFDTTSDQDLDQETPARWPGAWVLLGGLATSGLTLGLLGWLSNVNPDIQIMGWYVWFIIPAGAILGGIAAGSGCGLASWVTNAKIGKQLMWVVVLLQACSYTLAQYEEYKTVRDQFAELGGIELSFPEYFDTMTRSMTFTSRGGGEGKELGILGYGFRLLELVGFILGGLIVPAITMASPYCNKCGMYEKTKHLGVLPAGVVPRKVGRKDTEGQAALAREVNETLAEGRTLIDRIGVWAAEGDAASLGQCLDQHAGERKAIEKQTARTRLSVEHCPGCGQGRLVASLVQGQGKEQAELSKKYLPAHPNVIVALLQR